MRLLRFSKFLAVIILVSLIPTFVVLSQTGVTPATPSLPWDNYVFIPYAGGGSPIQATPTPTRTPTQPGPTATPTATQVGPTQTPTSTPPPNSNAIIVNRHSVALFEQIPEQYLTAARNMPMMFSDRSVGQNIHESLECLEATTWASSPNYCRADYYDTSSSQWLWKTYTLTDYNNGQVPERILFDPDPVLYNRSNWTFEYRPNTWEAIIADFSNYLVPTYIGSKNVLSFQFSYLNIDVGSNIDDLDDGYFVDLPHFGWYPNRERWDVSDVEALEAQYPNKVFIHWTTSLARGIGTAEGTNFNNQMRDYVLANDKILFDVADIESYTDLGVPCYDNRDSIEYCNSFECENHPNDGVNYPAICQDYTTEIDGGHLGSVSGARIRLAKAFWVLMARIAGWNP